MRPVTKSKSTVVVPAVAPEGFRGGPVGVWDLWRDGVTSTFIDSFLTCREQCRLAYVEGLTSRSLPLALEFGTCIHWCLEQIYGDKAVANDVADPAMRTRIATAIVDDYIVEWGKVNLGPTAAQVEQQELVYGLAEIILPHYLTRWAGDFTGTYDKRWPNATDHPVEWLSLEEHFKIPYVYPDGKQTWLQGRRDGVFLNRQGKMRVFDTKCLSVIDDAVILDTLGINFQGMVYLWVTWQQAIKNAIAINAGDTVYRSKAIAALAPVGSVQNVVRRPGQRRKDGEPLPTFLGRVRADVKDTGRYGHYFTRYQATVVPSEILAWKRSTLDPIMADVRAWYEGTAAHYTSHRNLVTKYGKVGLFDAIVKGDLSNCRKRTNPFPELSEK